MRQRISPRCLDLKPYIREIMRLQNLLFKLHQRNHGSQEPKVCPKILFHNILHLIMLINNSGTLKFHGNPLGHNNKLKLNLGNKIGEVTLTGTCLNNNSQCLILTTRNIHNTPHPCHHCILLSPSNNPTITTAGCKPKPSQPTQMPAQLGTESKQ
jgi:hypothetical protein